MVRRDDASRWCVEMMRRDDASRWLIEKLGRDGWLRRRKQYENFFSTIFIHRTLSKIHVSCISSTILRAILRRCLWWWTSTFIVLRHELSIWNERKTSNNLDRYYPVALHVGERTSLSSWASHLISVDHIWWACDYLIQTVVQVAPAANVRWHMLWNIL